MESSRIFIKGLPPTFTETEFKKHFSQRSEITDAKIFPNRRIGYVGYKTAEDAQKAVKYFHKTFIRMSRISVELARPPQDVQAYSKAAPTARREIGESDLKQNDGLKRKRGSQGEEDKTQDPKLKEFLEVMQPLSKKKALQAQAQSVGLDGTGQTEEAIEVVTVEHDDEDYEDVPKVTKRVKKVPQAVEASPGEVGDAAETRPVPENQSEQHDGDLEESTFDHNQDDKPGVSDSDWARSRTSRLLGLLDDGEEKTSTRTQYEDGEHVADERELEKGESKSFQAEQAANSIPTPPSDEADDNASKPATDDVDVPLIRSSLRLFVRNLPYSVTAQDLEAEFEPFGSLEEVHVTQDKKTGNSKGIAYVQFSDPDAAEQAMQAKDGQTFQGRLLHILPADKKRESKLDDFELSKLPLKKQQQIKRKREASSTIFNWNALYMNADAVVSSVANRLGLAKSEVLDPTSSDAAIKQAHAETHVIQETKAYFKQHGIELDAFKKSQRGDTAILVKNIPYDCSKDELRRLFEEHGEVKQFLMPPSEIIAIIQYANLAQCTAAFGALAYRKVKGSVLFLEKAPKGLFDGKMGYAVEEGGKDGVSKTSAWDLKNQDSVVPDGAGTATLFVRNLNFTTTTQQFTNAFQALEGLISARVKTKTDPKKPGQILSMGFGFLEFHTAQQAQAALKAMDGYNLDGHNLQIRASHKGADAAESRRQADKAKRVAGRRTKVIIKNLPFEATKKDVRALFGAYGQLRSVRVPKKMDRAARGFGFADFTTPKEAESAMDALRDTHLLGRRLVLDFAEEEPEDAEAEIEKMQQKVGAQINKVALQQLTSGGRKKFSTQQEEDVA